MRLLNTRTYQLRWFNPEAGCPQYAILSHVWDMNGEVALADLQDLEMAKKHRMWKKIEDFCRVAREDGYDWGWDDTCCIDKSSSSELSEAINSMHAWYREAGTCYAFLADVEDIGTEDPAAKGSTFRQSRWFTRGWTLQELIAPRIIFMMSKTWKPIGTKRALAGVIEEITNVDRTVLTNETPLEDISIARRMSWASNRQTTRKEDQAYSLMGLFGVNMPTIYGEEDKAFIRLQLAIIQQSSDHSLFAWGDAHTHEKYRAEERSDTLTHDPYWTRDYRSLLASTPKLFEHSAGIEPLPIEQLAERVKVSIPVPEYFPTNFGISIHLPLLPTSDPNKFLALLACQANGGEDLVALLLHRMSGSANRYHVGLHRRNELVPEPFQPVYRTFLIPLSSCARLDSSVASKLYIHSHNVNPQRSQEQGIAAGYLLLHGVEKPPPTAERIVFVFPGWMLRKLRATGFTVVGWDVADANTRAGWTPMNCWSKKAAGRLTFTTNVAPSLPVAAGKGRGAAAVQPQWQHGAIFFKGPNATGFVVVLGAYEGDLVWSTVVVRGCRVPTDSGKGVSNAVWCEEAHDIAKGGWNTYKDMTGDIARENTFDVNGPHWENGQRTFGNAQCGRVTVSYAPWETKEEMRKKATLTYTVNLTVKFGNASI